MCGPYYPKRRALGKFIGAPIAKVLSKIRWRPLKPDLPGGWRAFRVYGANRMRQFRLRDVSFCTICKNATYQRRLWICSVPACFCGRDKNRVPELPRDPREPRTHRDSFWPVTTWLGRFLARVVAAAVGVTCFDAPSGCPSVRDSFGREVATFLPAIYAELVNVAVPYLEGLSLDIARKSISYAARRLADPRCLAKWQEELARGDRFALVWVARIERRHPGSGSEVFPVFHSEGES